MQRTWAISVGTALLVTACKAGVGSEETTSTTASPTLRTVGKLLTGPYLSPTIAILALVISIATFVLTYKQASAAKVAASAAEEQAKSTDTQAREAIANTKTTELALLHEAQQSLRELTPRLIVGVETPCINFQGYDNDGHILEGKTTFDRLSVERIYTISAPVRGIIINDSNRSIVIAGSGLIGGNSSLWDKEVPPPRGFDELGFSLLPPGQAIIFEWNAGATVADWYDYLKSGADFDRKVAPCIPYQEYFARFASDHSGQRLHRIEVKLERPPVYIDNDSGELVVMDIKPGVYVSEKEIFPKNMTQLRKLMHVSDE